MNDRMRRYGTAFVEVISRKELHSRALDRVRVLLGAIMATLLVALVLASVIEPGTTIARLAVLPLIPVTVAIAALLVVELVNTINRFMR